MKNGQCPKCGSASIHSLANGIVPGGRDREYIQFGGMYSAINVQTFVCTVCGFYENYVADQNQLTEVGQKWPPVARRADLPGR